MFTISTIFLVLSIALSVTSNVESFMSKASFAQRPNGALTTLNAESDSGSTSPIESLQKNIEKRFRIYQDSTDGGASFKQAMANVIAGEYDTEAVRAEVEELSKSAPCVMFVWKSSPSCKKAIAAMDKTGAEYKLVRLDDPWEKGNKLRAELGKMTGKPSVPSVWIGGEYVGGFDAGVSDEKPGLVDMAFMGTLLPKLKAAGALKSA